MYVNFWKSFAVVALLLTFFTIIGLFGPTVEETKERFITNESPYAFITTVCSLGVCVDTDLELPDLTAELCIDTMNGAQERAVAQGLDKQGVSYRCELKK